MYFLMLMGLFFWWISRSSSVSLLMVLVFSVLSVMSYSFFLNMKMPLFMIVLTLSGGLFVLISFVIMFFPGDFKEGVIYQKKFTLAIFCCMMLFFLFLVLDDFEISSMISMGSNVKVWGNFIFVYLFLILLLFLFLFSLNKLMDMSTGSMFSKKKFGGKGGLD